MTNASFCMQPKISAGGIHQQQASQVSVKKELTVQYWDCGLCLPVHDERGPSGQCTIHEILWRCVRHGSN
ncbi:hypothetical protein [Paraburkholderia fungorum]|uniref:hypothetical protein n=1 Tax=Paraburkholderia fungorum TaxID=134537 RepID=UPI0038BAB3EA